MIMIDDTTVINKHNYINIIIYEIIHDQSTM